MKTANVVNCARSFEFNESQSKAVLEEKAIQKSEEQDIVNFEIQFIETISRPLFLLLIKLIPEISPFLTQLENNLTIWKSRLASSS